MRTGRGAWLAGVALLVVLIACLPTTGVVACSDPGGCAHQGMEFLAGLVTWPYLPSGVVVAYLFVLLLLSGVLAVTAIRSLRHHRP